MRRKRKTGCSGRNAGVDEHDTQQRVHETFFFYATGYRVRVYLFVDEGGIDSPAQRTPQRSKGCCRVNTQVSRFSLFVSKPYPWSLIDGGFVSRSQRCLRAD